jgi:hypothetical protein
MGKPAVSNCFLRDLPLEPDVETLYLQWYFQTNQMVEEIADQLRRDIDFQGRSAGEEPGAVAKDPREREPCVSARPPGRGRGSVEQDGHCAQALVQAQR